MGSLTDLDDPTKRDSLLRTLSRFSHLTRKEEAREPTSSLPVARTESWAFVNEDWMLIRVTKEAIDVTSVKYGYLRHVIYDRPDGIRTVIESGQDGISSWSAFQSAASVCLFQPAP